LSLVHIHPEQVELTIDVFDSVEFPVAFRAIDSVAQGFSSHDPIITPYSVTISGPHRILEQIGEVAVSLDLGGRTGSFEGVLPVILYDKDDLEFYSARLRLSYTELSVRVPISENLSSKSVAVRTALSGNVDDRYIMAGMEVSPSTVMISGPYAAISMIDYLNTEPIDLASMTETFQGFVRLIVPPGVTVLEGDRVEITIRIEQNLVRRYIVGIPVEIRNAPDDFVYEADPATIDVTLSAYPEVFDGATIDGELLISIVAYIDLEGQPVEERLYTIVVEIPEEYLLSQVSEASASLSLRE
jgi:YbbR domain-containing protein